MLIWIREFCGWLLLGLALLLVKIGIDYVSTRHVVEAGVVAMMALGLLRAGVLLIRMSTAARIAIKEVSGRQ